MKHLKGVQVMALPQREAALRWIGKMVVDREGLEIGMCTAVLAHASSGLAEWLFADLGGMTVLVPAVDAVETGDRVQVTVARVDALSAPTPGDAEPLSEDRLSEEEEAALYEHYRVPHPRSTVPTQAGPSGQTARARRLALLAPAVLGGLAAVLAALVGMRRRRNRRPPTPTELLARHARNASVHGGSRHERRRAAG